MSTRQQSKKLLAELDDIGFVGIPNHTPTPDDRAFFAQKAMEARQRYRTSKQEKTVSTTQKLAMV
jgi:hypothetical protein